MRSNASEMKSASESVIICSVIRCRTESIYSTARGVGEDVAGSGDVGHRAPQDTHRGAGSYNQQNADYATGAFADRCVAPWERADVPGELVAGAAPGVGDLVAG